MIVAGGGMVGRETVVYLAQKGRKVTTIEMMGQLIPEEEMHFDTRMGLLNMVKQSIVDVFTISQLLDAFFGANRPASRSKPATLTD